MKILLVGNYGPDRQQSMARYWRLIHSSIGNHEYQVDYIQPASILGRISVFPPAIKWLGYVDKFIIFPPCLLLRCGNYDIVHVCDHSNAVYHYWTGSTPSLITCHDMLAIRGARGEDALKCKASWFGRHLQAWIFRALLTAPFLAFASETTRADFLRLAGRPLKSDLGVVLNPLNAPFSPTPDTDPLPRTRPDLLHQPYLLMVGSSHRRKNRESIIRLIAHLGARWTGLLVVAGAPLNTHQRELANKLGVAHRIVEVVNPDHDMLNSLYVHAHALLFPSRAEGFGWPVIEAQQCDCPVICSNTTSVPEVAGRGAVLCGPDDLAALADAVLKLLDSDYRRQLISAGRDNLERFHVSTFRERYLSIYRHILASN